MSTKDIVLVTGVRGYWGARVAARLAALPGLHVIGLDTAAPEATIQGLDFIQADVRNPLLTPLLKDEGVSAVCHLAFSERTRPSESAFDLNVMGSMRVLGACTEAGVRKVVLRSSTMVYGARADNSAFLAEEHPLRGDASIASVRDLMEIEAFCNGYRRQAPEMAITLLRFPGIIGPTADTPLTRFLSSRRAPALLGFDPMMQVIHEDDVVGALTHAVLADVSGTFNVAAEGVVPLSKLMALAGKFPLPVLHLIPCRANPLLAGLGLPVHRFWPIPPDYLRYPWVGDVQLMSDVLGFTPRYGAEEALREFAGRGRPREYRAESGGMTYDTERLQDTIERRRRQREQQASSASMEPNTMEGEAQEETV